MPSSPRHISTFHAMPPLRRDAAWRRKHAPRAAPQRALLTLNAELPFSCRWFYAPAFADIFAISFAASLITLRRFHG
jgi:hypothetical protein